MYHIRGLLRLLLQQYTCILIFTYLLHELNAVNRISTLYSVTALCLLYIHLFWCSCSSSSGLQGNASVPLLVRLYFRSRRKSISWIRRHMTRGKCSKHTYRKCREWMVGRISSLVTAKNCTCIGRITLAASCRSIIMTKEIPTEIGLKNHVYPRSRDSRHFYLHT